MNIIISHVTNQLAIGHIHLTFRHSNPFQLNKNLEDFSLVVYVDFYCMLDNWMAWGLQQLSH
jgi:hypothetical protein